MRGGLTPPERDRPPVRIDGDPQLWYEDSAAALLDALRSTPADTPAWTWWGEPATVGAIARHQAQEAAVHRWDAELAAGRDGGPRPLPAEVGHDGVDEFLTVMADGEPAASIAFESTDTNGRWTLGPSSPQAVVRATASDLVLLLYRRIGLDAVEVEGDVAAAQAALAATSTE